MKVHFPCCSLDIGEHEQDIPDDHLHNYRMSYHGHEQGFPDNPQLEFLLFRCNVSATKGADSNSE
jgi:hypothetical protein